MAKETGDFTMDFTNFEKDFVKLCVTTVPDQAEKGLVRGAWELLHDADNIEPKTPKEKGDLRGSKKVDRPEISKNEISVPCGYNIVYAAYQHEKEMTDKSKYRLPGSGSKFLETKMVRYKEKYMKIVVDYIKKVLGS